MLAFCSRRVHARWAALLFVGLLLTTQGLLANHEIEHLTEHDTDFCELCLIGGSVAGAIAAEMRIEAPVLPARAVPRTHLAIFVPHRIYRPQIARAPPLSIPISR
jgi:hypothetical protein